jgi:cobalt-precorrin 5A hydrolase
MASGPVVRQSRRRNDSVRQTPIAILAVTRTGVRLALQLQAQLPGSVCYVPLRHRFALAMGARGFERLEHAFQEAWTEHRGLVCIMATGIVVRQIAGLLRHKTLDPAVVVMDEHGEFVISLLSGHLGGANQLARDVARLTHAQPVITTASDVQGKPALDLIALSLGLEIENRALLARITRALLEDEPLWIYDPERRLEAHLADQPQVVWLASQGGAPKLEQLLGAGIWVTERMAPGDTLCLQLRPRNLVVGIGCNRGTPAEQILGLVRSVFAGQSLSLLSIRNLASIDLKADEPGLLEAAAALDRPIHFFCREAIEAISVPNPSPMVAKHIGVESVCEATALVSAADRGQSMILIPKQKTHNVTLAVARVSWPL